MFLTALAVKMINLFLVSLVLAAEEESETIGLTLAEKVNNFYNWALAIGAIAALGIIVFGGILYITSTGSPGRLREARAWITAALVGLIILFGSFLILKTLNPKLTKLEDIVLPINPEAVMPEPPVGGVGAGCGYQGGNTCNGYWNSSRAPKGNFGDPGCEFEFSEAVAKDKLYAHLQLIDPAYADHWFYTVIPCESSYNPNEYFRCGGGNCTPQPTGAWGLFQTGCQGSAHPNDYGNVPWPAQANNAVRIRQDRGGAYWGCWN